jgi:Outer membrane protein beta-barrel domain
LNRVSKILVNLSVLIACAASASASADNLLGLYVGAGAGESTVRSDHGFDPYYPGDSHPHHTAWELLAGIRPIPFVGAEAQYIDFGHPSSADSSSVVGSGYYGRGADSHPKAGILSGVGYLPLPFVDVFAKVGMARLETNINTYGPGPCIGAVSGTCGSVLSRQNASETKVAYGAGVQAHFLGLAVRGEYERISSTFGDPDAFMVSATWTF